jgi:signal peptidase II
MTRKARAFAVATLLLLATDCSTKRLAVGLLPETGQPVALIGDLVRLTLAFNTRGAAGMPLGRLPLIAFSVTAIGVIAWQYAKLSGRDGRAAAALGMILGGAIGNLVDRAWSARGVVDFIDVGVGRYRYWTFNVADVGIVLGVALLLLSGALAEPNPTPPGPDPSPSAPPE